MRAFRISLVLFAVLVALIIVGTWYGRHVCDELQSMTDALPDAPEDEGGGQVMALMAYWQRQTPYLRPIVNRTVVRTMSDLISDLAIYAAEEDSTADYRATRERLLGAIDEMRRSEKATFGLWS